MKEAYYFSHDSNARTDEKILALRSVYGAEGYGWYWMLIEKMRDANAFRLQCGGKYDAYAIAVDLQCDVEKLKKFISDCIEEFHLFDSDGKFFWSNSLIGRMTIRQQKSEKASLAARKRWEQSERNADAMQAHSERNAIKGKEKKGKEIGRKVKSKGVFTPPSVNEVVNYFTENGYPDFLAKKAFQSYDVAGWVDTKGNAIRNWKQKMINVWFKEEHRIVKKEAVVRELVEKPMTMDDYKSLYE